MHTKFDGAEMYGMREQRDYAVLCRVYRFSGRKWDVQLYIRMFVPFILLTLPSPPLPPPPPSPTTTTTY